MSLLQEMAIEFGLSLNEVSKIIATAPRRYKSFPIPKRGGGERIISQPAKEIKILQRYVMEKKLSLFPIHDVAAAYVTGRGIVDNALRHVGSDYILKLDFEAFFPSIVPRDLELANRRVSPRPLENLDLETYYKLLFWGKGSAEPICLSIGAPTSPMLSNIVMHHLDRDIQEAATGLDIVITRYADDITASGSSRADLLRLEKTIESLLRASASPKLRLNTKKRGLYDKGQRRMVTGLILTPDGRVSIGRERKRRISTLIHKVLFDEVDQDHLLYTKGMLGFAIAADPSFVTSMREKYGNEIINMILKTEAPV